jgi:hypothetical protein
MKFVTKGPEVVTNGCPLQIHANRERGRPRSRFQKWASRYCCSAWITSAAARRPVPMAP